MQDARGRTLKGEGFKCAVVVMVVLLTPVAFVVIGLLSANNNPSARESGIPKSDSRVETVESQAPVIPGGRALHVIGVQEGTPAAGVDNSPWWNRCKKDPRVIKDPDLCHSLYAGTSVATDVKVNVSNTEGPLVLAFMAQEHVRWRVKTKKKVKIDKVILAGAHAQEVLGLPPGVPVEIYTREPSPCSECLQSDKYFHSDGRDKKSVSAALSALRGITGLQPSTKQFRQKGKEFAIPNTKR